MSSRVWMSDSYYSLGSLSANTNRSYSEPVINTQLRRDLEDKNIKIPGNHKDDIEDLLKEIEI